MQPPENPAHKFSQQAIRNLQAEWFKLTGQKLDEETARQIGVSLVGLVGSVVKWKANRARDSPH